MRTSKRKNEMHGECMARVEMNNILKQLKMENGRVQKRAQDGSHGTEITPGSNIIGEDFKNHRLSHGFLL
jgi:hypothetical protein